MGYDIETARRYREHPARLRRVAAGDENPKIRESIMRIAQDYESMAQAREAADTNCVNNVTPLKAGPANHKH